MNRRRHLTLGDLDFRSNSIGFLRLFLASTVLWSHSYGICGFGYDPIGRLSHGNVIAGLLAVGGFFVLSGFLITRSYETASSAFVYLWHRFLRIFPAFWICLIATAFGFAPLAYLFQHGALAGFFAGPDSPWSYVATNALLVIRQPGIRGLLATLPAPLTFNGSLWTLLYEFCCYLVVAIFGLAGLIKRAPALLALVSLCAFLLYGALLWRFSAHGVAIGLDVLSLLVYFGFGSSAYLLRERIPMRWWLAALCAAALLVALPTRAGAYVVIPCISYVTLFAAMKLPLRNFDRRVDLSYGIYIYAFPVQQVLVLYGVGAWGLAPYLAIAFAIVLMLAAASWFTIEKPSLSLKGLFSGRTRRAVKLRTAELP